MNKDITDSGNCNSFDKKSIVEAVNQVLKMVSGQGQFHTANPEAKTPSPTTRSLLTRSPAWLKIRLMFPRLMRHGHCLAVFTDRLPGAQIINGRTANFMPYGLIWMRWGPIPPEGIADCISMIVGADTQLIVYNTKSATPENQKCRVIIPLAEPCPGKDFEVYQRILNNKTSKEFPPDRKTETANQICYLPNQGRSL